LIRNRPDGSDVLREKKRSEYFGGSCGFSFGGSEQRGNDRQEPWQERAHNDDGIREMIFERGMDGIVDSG
jgi:hypothetical protein